MISTMERIVNANPMLNQSLG